MNCKDVFQRKVMEVLDRMEIGDEFHTTDVSNACRGKYVPSDRECMCILLRTDRVARIGKVRGSRKILWRKVRE